MAKKDVIYITTTGINLEGRKVPVRIEAGQEIPASDLSKQEIEALLKLNAVKVKE